ncbi:MAG: hypothetical protein CYPHOPRED_004694 [Cyphobasidiales sp. Tagirdzhanova-0007]|nr:MAG: hypothetical protein CYPHOPRED_004694 [Cyphobasidiales sp. Tagirdzhanova-0007]
MAAAVASPMHVLDERVDRASQRFRSLALNALNRPRSPLPHAPHRSQRVPVARGVDRRPSPTSTAQRKAKFGTKHLSNSLSEALQKSVELSAEKEPDNARVEEGSKPAAQHNLLDMASTKPKRPKHSRLLSDYEIISTPHVIALDNDESNVGGDWEWVESVEERDAKEALPPKTYAEVVVASAVL